jgi:hypothetical protein
MIEHPHTRRRAQEARSQVATEILLVLYALLATIVLIRTVLVLLGISDRVWVGSFVYGLTAPLTDALAVVPGFTRELLGPLTMVELILLGLVVLFPLGLVATGGRYGR